MFCGPQDYVTPSWYETKRETGKVVPTWNYVTVHAWGRPRVIHDDVWLRRQIEDLTDSRERLRAAPWKVDDAPPDFIAAQMRAIIGVEIPISRIEGKWKMSQIVPRRIAPAWSQVFARQALPAKRLRRSLKNGAGR